MTDVGLSGAEVDSFADDEAEPNEYILEDGRFINEDDHDLLTRLRAVYDFFELRDRMNARLHMAVADDIRWSPITIEVENLLADLEDRLCYVKDNTKDNTKDNKDLPSIRVQVYRRDGTIEEMPISEGAIDLDEGDEIGLAPTKDGESDGSE